MDTTTLNVGIKVYGIDAADRAAYRTLRQEVGLSPVEANVVTTIAVVFGAAGPDAHLHVTVDGEPVDHATGNIFALASALQWITENPDVADKATAYLAL